MEMLDSYKIRPVGERASLRPPQVSHRRFRSRPQIAFYHADGMYAAPTGQNLKVTQNRVS